MKTKGTFDQVCESFGVIKTTKKMLYPRQINFSPEFLNALKREYYGQKLTTEDTKPIKDHVNKFLKAVNFHIHDFESNSAVGLAEMRKIYDESSEPYVVKVDGKEVNREGQLEQDDKKANKIKKQIPLKNTDPKEEVCPRTAGKQFTKSAAHLHKKEKK